jgi:DNA-directed RNA polymerase specialized sigma24 family protein
MPSVYRPIEDLGDAFGSLQQSLRSYLRRRLHDPVQAEDLLQDIFVKGLTSERAGRRINNPAVRARTMLKEALLRCCRVETVNGVVTDYQRVSPPECGGKCA